MSTDGSLPADIESRSTEPRPAQPEDVSPVPAFPGGADGEEGEFTAGPRRAETEAGADRDEDGDGGDDD